MNRYLLLTLLAVFALGADADADAKRCRDIVRMTDPTYAIEPGVLIAASDSMPEYCHVRGVINRAIRFEVTLPTEWNGRLMFTAVGGAAGTIGDIVSLVPRGFAMASTDTGHEGQDFGFIPQPEAFLDYAYRGVHLATVATKAVIASYYERPADHAYLQGCSNGGRAALLEAIHFPHDYDGIIAGAPAFRFSEFVPWAMGANARQVEHPLDPDALRLLDANSERACDRLDGAEDGLINDPRKCTLEMLNLEGLQCRGAPSAGCLTAGQIETATYMYTDVVNAEGQVVSPRVEPGVESAGDWAAWMLPGSNPIAGEEPISINGSMTDLMRQIMLREPGFSLESFNPANDRDQLTEACAPLDVSTADLTEFRDHGGKLLIYQGWNDYPLRPQRAIDYLEAAEEAAGGARKTADFFRLFMVPGMTHCAGGSGPWQADWAAPLVAWREDGDAPDVVMGTYPGQMDFAHINPDKARPERETYSRPLCPYPELARYRGGDPNDLTNFQCD